MSKIILAINAGSSSVKVSVFSYTPPTNNTTNTTSSKENSPDQIDTSLTELAQIQISNLTASPALLTYTRQDINNNNNNSATTAFKNSPLPPSISTPRTAFHHILTTLLQDPDLPALNSPSDITVAVHRIVHGGGEFHSPTFLDSDTTVAHLERLSDLAPLHNGGALEIVGAMRDMGDQGGKGKGRARNLGMFDTMFHSSLPPEEREYMISPAKARSEGLRRYGFHGISYAFVTRSVGEWLSHHPFPPSPAPSSPSPASQHPQPPKHPAQGPNLIALHLGSGCSATCIQGGKSLATSMGLTPVSGLPGATRSGDVDPSLIFHYTHSAGRLSTKSAAGAQAGRTAEGDDGDGKGGKAAGGGGGGGGGMPITRAEEILNQESGWKSITGTTDFGAICSRAFPPSSSTSTSTSSSPAAATKPVPEEQEQEERRLAHLAFTLLVTRIVDFIAAYYVKLSGEVDALVFAGGVGEKSPQLRRAVVERVKSLGFEVDGGANAEPEFTGEEEGGGGRGVVAEIGKSGAKHRVLVCQTDEQREMARECVGFV
ncbi:acetate kinase [Hortaea werneckii]|nr:acetate kinase [Hortaea werneckii]